MPAARIALLTVALLAAVVSGAAAAPPWAPAVTLQAGLSEATTSGVVVTPRGTLVSGWSHASGARDDGASLAVRRAGAAGASVREIASQLAEGPVAYGADHAAVMTVRYGRIVGCCVPQSLYLRTLNASTGVLSHSTPLIRDAMIDDYDLVGGPKGTVAIAWIDQRSGGDVVSYAVRGSDGRVGAPHVVSGRGHAEKVTVAYDGAGDLLIAYAARYRGGAHRVFARVQAAGQRRVGHQSDLGPQTGALDLVGAGAPTGSHFTVAWQTEDPAGAGPGFPPRVYATTGDAGGHFQATQTLDAGTTDEYADGALQAAWGADGVATLAWSSPTRAGDELHAATATAGQSFVGVDLHARGATSDIAVQPDGATTLLATADAGGVVAVSRPAGRRDFGAVQTVDTDTSDEDVVGAAGPDGHVHALWVAGGQPPAGRPNGPPEGQVLRIADR